LMTDTRRSDYQCRGIRLIHGDCIPASSAIRIQAFS
jgi:hypothetical protein